MVAGDERRGYPAAPQARGKDNRRSAVPRFLKGENALQLLLVFVPVALILDHLTNAGAVAVFATSALAIIPLAGLMGRATEELSERLGQGVGGLLNATFGNAAELIIAGIALRAGYFDLVKASITGSIIGNILLVFGLSALAGGVRHPTQRFNRTAASQGGTLLVLSGIGLVVPAIFHILVRGTPGAHEQEVSLEIAVVLFLTYLLSLIFTLHTHSHLYTGEVPATSASHPVHPVVPARRSITMLVLATVGIAVMAELLVGAAEVTAHALGWSDVFVGVILVAVIGNAAEHSTAVLMALKNKMDVAVNIAVGSSIQVALFVAPLLLFLSYVIAPSPMNLIFTPLEVLAVVLAVGIIALIADDGETHWMEGVQLLAVYIILGIAFFYIPV
jgi:Ca2+:H+ antiporter